mmetsp:Transcript_30420/g.72376  ORF Transcript_30420/g.72376 Transcript_30420/m.72376 type:complete len:191 (-) Transcript_30420:203-775(-)
MKEIRDKLDKGINFSELARVYSRCPSANDGGSLGWVRKGATVPEFEECIFAADAGQTTECTTEYGRHLVLVEEERAAVPAVQTMGPLELKELLSDPGMDVQLVDVREGRELELASIPGFEHFPLSAFGEWEDTIAEDLDPSKKTLCLCHHGIRSQQMAQFLIARGFTDVVNVAGGIDAYSRLADPSIPKY